MYCIIVGPAYPLRGGIAHGTTLLYQELARRHRVEIITFSRQYPDILFPGKTQREAGGSTTATPSEELLDSINPLNWLRVGNMICERKPDLVIITYWMPFFGPCFGTLARRAKRNGVTRILYLCHNIIPHEKRPGDLAFTRYAFKPADAFVVLSGAVEQELLSVVRHPRYRVSFLPVYDIFGKKIDKTRARQELGITAKRVLLFFGYIRKYKGLDYLLEALSLVKQRIDCVALVVGEFYEGEERYRSMIRTLGIEKNVILYSGYVPNEEVGRFFSAADAVVLPYTSATQSGIVQIAYNFDTPVIATTVGGLGEVVKDEKTGFLVPPGNAAALADAILRFYDEGLQERFSGAVAEEKKNYTWESLAGTIEDLAFNETR